MSSDSKTFTFHLRSGLKFSDGSALTSADVVATFQNYFASKTFSEIWPTGITVSAPDPSTVVFTTPKPTPLFAERYVAEDGIYPKGSSLDAMNVQPLSGGPFYLASWTKGQGMVFKRNQNYWNQPYPCLDELDFHVIPDGNTQALQLEAGQVDFAQDIPTNQIATLKTAPGTTVATFPTWASMEIRLDEVKQPAFKDLQVRQAMNYAIDKQSIIDAVLFGTGTVEDSPVPKTPNYVAQTPYTYDVTKAQQLMAQSKYPNGFSTTLLIASGDSVGVDLAAIVKEELAAIKINVTIQQVDPATQTTMFTQYDYEMAYTPFTADNFDDSQYICYVESNVCGIDAYWSGYRNPQVESLITQLLRRRAQRRVTT